MPYIERQVGFVARPTLSRQPKEAEYEAMYRFARHASHCEQCADPYSVHVAGQTLCRRGHEHARKVALYVYNKDGRACSTSDLADYQSVQIEIPVGCEAVRGLLRAVERGMRLRKAKKSEPVVSYDRSYFVARRPVARKDRSKEKRTKIEIVDPPRLSESHPAHQHHHHHDERIVYADNYEDDVYYAPQDAPVYSPCEDNGNLVFYAAPKSQRRSSSYVYGEEFYR
ncbi:MAG: hypothetical protein M1825_005516 [Sarcosagium campestre]|nr:MAG: hypothetical protein M1825_005516 [Sarcosagium campestre]